MVDRRNMPVEDIIRLQLQSEEEFTDKCFSHFKLGTALRGAAGSADFKISKSALLSSNHHNFSNTKPIYTE